MKLTRFTFFLIAASLMVLMFASGIFGAPVAHPTPPAARELTHCGKFHVVADLDVVKAGEIVTFSIQSEKLQTESSYFEWTINRGYLISGQGTSKIMVQTTEEMLRQPVTLPDPGPEGYLVRGWPRLSIVATAKLINGKQSGCPFSTATVSAGRQSSVFSNRWANVTALELSGDQLFLPCRQDSGLELAPSPSMTIDVSTTAHDEEGDLLVYSYTLNGGRIIGKGAKVKWDLSGAEPGSYEITAGADDGCGICGKTITKTVTVHGC